MHVLDQHVAEYNRRKSTALTKDIVLSDRLWLVKLIREFGNASPEVDLVNIAPLGRFLPSLIWSSDNVLTKQPISTAQ